MLACVCQPPDPNIFKRTPIPLGAPPLRLPSAGAIPKPGKPIRLAPTTPKENKTPTNSVDSPSNSNSSSSAADSVRKKCRKRCLKNPTVVSPDLSAVNRRDAVKWETSKSSGDKIRSESGDDAGSCDKGRDEKANNYKKLPEGVQLTLSELREMACRQQAQIDSQHQLLAAKEQRLRYLKEQEARQQRVHAESERLRRLRDRVDAQELKLRKLRALRGQVDHQKQNNISLTSDLDSMRALFNEKEKELSLAVAKVEELTRQLEELRRGRSSRDQPPPSALELDKLRRELMYRNKLNEQQNQRLNQQREALTARQEEMSAIDRRISELQERLHRKRLLNQQLANQISAASHKAAYHQLVRLTSNPEQNNQAFTQKKPQNIQPPNGLSRGNIAAVEPYNHVPLQPGHQSRNSNVQENSTYHQLYQQNQHIKKDVENQNNIHENLDLANKMANLFNPRSDDIDALKDFAVSKADPKYQTLPYNTKFTVNLVSSKLNGKSENLENGHATSESKDQESNQTSTTQPNGNNLQSSQQQHMTVHSAPLNMANKNIATPLNHNDLLSRKSSEQKKDHQNNLANGNVASAAGQKIQHESVNYTTSSSTNGVAYQKPISSVAPTSVQHSGLLSNIYQTSSIKVQPVEPQTVQTSNKQMSPAVTSASSQTFSTQSPSILALSPPQSTSTPVATPEANNAAKPALPPKPAIKPPPRQTQIISDQEHAPQPPPLPLTEPPEEGNKVLQGPKLNQNQTPKSTQPKLVQKAFYPPPSQQQQNNVQNVSNGSAEMIIKAKPLTIKKQPLSEQPKLRSNTQYLKQNGSSLSNRRIEIPPAINFPELQNLEKNSEPNSPTVSDKDLKEGTEKPQDEPDRSPTINKDEKPIDGVVRRCKKGNLKQTGKSNLSRRVSFDPLALLLDASLEGELELVKKTATQVTNPSAANDEGITALHNAICAGHLEIVKFLVEFGCDVNAQDSDGWTPLHCAASCNNVAMVKFLVEHGACIFATTLSDHETAAEKCEEDEEGFDGCSEYLYSVQEKLGILSGGIVYAVFDYTAQQPDELSFKAGQQLTVLRKGDENEREWWWSRLGDKEGYVPRNLLGLYPRVNRSDE